jgi:hypothetical protein
MDWVPLYVPKLRTFLDIMVFMKAKILLNFFNCENIQQVHFIIIIFFI